VPATHTLDALVFSSPGRPWAGVMVAGRWVVRDGAHPRALSIAQAFEEAMTALWAIADY
jgi:formimidoylglutamate deiminase